MSAILLPAAVTFYLLAGAEPANISPDAAVELRYHGAFSKVSRDGEAMGDPAKRFDLYCLSTTPRDAATAKGREVAFLLEEHGGGGWPWMERFGSTATDAKNHPAKNRLRLLYDDAGTEYVLFVPFPLFEFADRLEAGAHWEAPRLSELPNQQDAAPWKYSVVGSAAVRNRDCWRVNVTNNFGPQESLWVEKKTGLLVKAERKIVIGRGDVHVLKMDLDIVSPLTDEAANRQKRAIDALLKLQAQLKRAAEDRSHELHPEQLQLVASSLKSLERDAERTPFESFVAAIRRDVEGQSRRAEGVDSLAKRFVGKKSPPLTLKSLDDEPVDAADRAGKIVLLHFWSYQGEPFPREPYGQVGYLDYLHNRRKKVGLKVYGVAVDKRFGEPGQAGTAVRSVKKLQSFMNLSYPLTRDDGTLLEKFGNPEKIGARLPLWVLIDAEGTVVHYRAGNFDIKSDEGLAPLDTLIVELVKKQRKTKVAAPSGS